MAHSFGVTAGNATDFSTASPLFGNSDNNNYIRSGAATASGTSNNVAGLGIQWSLLTSSAAAPSLRQNSTASEFQALDKFILVSATKTADAMIASLKGVAFTISPEFLASRNASGTAVQGVTGGFTLDMGAEENNITGGTLNLCIGANTCSGSSEPWERWQVAFSGHLANGKIDQMALAGSIVIGTGSGTTVVEGGNVLAVEPDRPLSGTLSGFLTGNSAEGLVAGFKIFESAVTSNSIIGSTVFKAAPAISTSEINALTREGFAIVAKNSTATNMGIHMGKTPDLFTAGAQGDVLVYSSSPGFVLSSAGITGTETPNSLDYNFHWGRWTGTAGEPLKYHPNLNNKGIHNEIASEVIVVSLQPSLVADLTGTHAFTADNTFLVTGPNTSGATLSGSFTINFNTGALSSGLLTLQLSNETWTASSFSGSVVSGKLAPVNLTGTVQNNSAETSNPFTGSFAGRLTGSTNLGFLAGFDLVETGGSLARSGAAFLVGTAASPVLTSSEYANLHADRFGFVLGRAFPAATPNSPLAVYGRVKVNDGDGDANLAGVTETLVSSNASSPLTTNTEPAFIYQRHDAGVASRSYAVNGTGVNWGKWDASGVNNYRLFTNYANNSQFVGGSDSLLFVNFVPTTPAQLPTTGTRTYLGLNESIYGAVDTYLYQGSLDLWRLKSAFDIDFSTGNVVNGILALCVRGTSCGAGSEDWEFEYTGSFTQGILTSFNISNTRIDNTSTPLTASLAGGFTGSFSGTSHQTYVGGVHIYKNSAPGDYLRAAYLLGVGSYLSADEIIGFNLGEYGMLATAEGAGIADVFGGRSQRRGNSDNYLLADYELTGDSWYDDSPFHTDQPQQIFRKGGASQSVVTNVGGLGSLLTWGEWDSESGARIVRDSLNSTDSELTQDAYWFIATPSAPGQLAGKYASYSSVLAAQGGSNEGEINSGNLSTFGFTLNLDTGAISNGKLKIYTGDNTWTAAFNGMARSKTGTFGPFVSLNVTSAKVKDDDVYESSNVSGNIGGMFINSGNQAVAAFAFKNDDTLGAGEYVSGTAALGKENIDAWGNWNSTLVSNWTSQLVTDAQSLFSSLQLTPQFVVANMTGEYRYSTVNPGNAVGTGTGSSSGSLTAINSQFDINFETGLIDGGHIAVTIGNTPKVWRVEFDGEYDDGILSLETLANSLTIDTVANTGTASIGGRFTGANADGFAGAFNMQDGLDAANTVQGAFSLGTRVDISDE